MKILIIVESPTKAKTLKKYLGNDYIVCSSYGHVFDLPESEFGINIQNNFEPKFVPISGKQKLISGLKKMSKESNLVLLATDADREGEAISYHLSTLFPSKKMTVKRVILKEYTPTAIQNSIQKTTNIDKNLVEAQITRRILDRIVGYTLSPFLWKAIQGGLSAGRVQSVTLKWLCERDLEIKNFQKEEFWELFCNVKTKNFETFQMQLSKKNGQKIKIKNKEEINQIINVLQTFPEQSNPFPERSRREQILKISNIKEEKKVEKPYPPFTTSTLQKAAHITLSFTTSKTMKTAQSLYEGVDLSHGYRTGLITYMRTDSTRVSDKAHHLALSYIKNVFGEKYCGSTYNIASKKSGIQDAHEAIRPVDVNITPESTKDFLHPDQYKLYNLIWNRFVSSRMSPEELSQITVEAIKQEYTFETTQKRSVFPGYKILYPNKKDQITIPENLKIGDVLEIVKFIPEQKFTSPPP
ncbi:MAG: type I DNA topoisomerase, partial [Leptospiraceae bacterium]|nr:type I DNA topoisomerase [Leptospiraceae bacterium]